MKIKNNYQFILFALTFSTIISACNNGSEIKTNDEQTTKSNESVTYIKAPEFNSDTAFGFISTQVEFGPRVPNSKAQKQCEQFIVNTLKRYDLKITEQKTRLKAFDDNMLYCNNIMGSINPEMANRIFISAHWDTRPFADQDKQDTDKPIDGANDGGSGVGVMLEIARVLSNQKPNIGIDLIFFDCEDYGQPRESKYPQMQDSYCLGSQYWAKNKPLSYAPKYGINLDMVGNANATFTKEGTSVYYAYGVVEKVWQTAARAGYQQFFVDRNTSPITDDHAYVNELAKIPCIDIIHHDPTTPSNFPYTWHTHQDNLSNIDKGTLKAVGQTLLELIYNEK